MKKLLFITWLSASAVLLEAAGVQVSVQPRSVTAGEPFTYILSFEGEPTEQLALPKLVNGEWLTNRVGQQISVINGKRSLNLSIGILATAPGTLTIPAFPVKVDGAEVQTQPLEVKVLPEGEKPALPESSADNLPMRDAVFGRIRYPDERTTYYVGEEIPMVLSLYTLSELRPNLRELPELSDMENAVFRTFNWRTGQPPSKFEEPSQKQQVINGRDYYEFDFLTAFRAVAPGKLTPKATLTIGIAPADRQNGRRPASLFDDDFFDSFFSGRRSTPHTVHFESPSELTIKPLPPAPAGSINLGLVGSWKLTGRFDQTSTKVGEPLTLNLTITGSGSPETLSAPKLKLNDMRVYPPEVKKEERGTGNAIDIRYALVPLKAGEFTSTLKFATFDPASGKYATHEVDLALPIGASDRPLTPAFATGETAPAPVEEAVETPEESKPARDDLFYQKKAPGAPVRLPLASNMLPWAIALVLIGFLAALAIELRRRQLLRAEQDPEYLRRKRLKQAIPGAIARIKTAAAQEEFRQALHDEALPLLAEALHLPPGATPGEIAAKVGDPALKTLLESSESSGFMPGSSDGIPRSAEAVQLIVRALKKYALLFVTVAAAFSAGAATADPFQRGNAEFAAGNYRAAEKSYLEALDPSAPSPGVLYNLGATAYRLGKLPLAKVYFERALLLDPRDTETLENLNLINRKLLQPETGKTDTPAHLLSWCRDRLRPDQYLGIAAAAFAILLVGLALRRKLPRPLAAAINWSAAAIWALALLALVSQMRGPYRSDRAVLLGSSVELRTLPASGSGRVEATVPGGSSATILDRRDQWVRVEANGKDGWVPAGKVEPVLPSGIF